MRVLSDFTPDLEIYSIDEAFLGMDGFGASLEAHARALRATVLQWTGIPVSVGIAPTKTLAKVANHIAKKDAETRRRRAAARRSGAGRGTRTPAADRSLGHRRPPGGEAQFARHHDAARICKQADPRFIRERLSVVVERLVLELRGVSCLDLERHTPDRKSIMASRSFGRPVDARSGDAGSGCRLHDARGRETAPADSRDGASRGLHRDQPLQTGRDGSISRRSRCSCRSRPATAASSSARRAPASPLIWRPGYRYKKAGVLLLDLHPANQVQESLFDRTDDARRITLMRTLDKLNQPLRPQHAHASPPPASTSPGRCSAIGSRRATPRHGMSCCASRSTM